MMVRFRKPLPCTLMEEKVRRLGPYSKPAVLAKLDQRTREARILHDTREALTEHIGENPSATARALIDRAAWLSLRVAQMDAKMAAGNAFTDHDHRHYLAWSNSLRLILRDLGLKGTPARATKPMDAIAYGKLLDARRAAETSPKRRTASVAG